MGIGHPDNDEQQLGPEIRVASNVNGVIKKKRRSTEDSETEGRVNRWEYLIREGSQRSYTPQAAQADIEDDYASKKYCHGDDMCQTDEVVIGLNGEMERPPVQCNKDRRRDAGKVEWIRICHR